MRTYPYLKIFAGMLCITMLNSCSSTKAPSPVITEIIQPVKPWTGTDSLSYAIGVQVATYYKNQGMDSVSTDLLVAAFEDVFADTTLKMTLDSSNMTIQKKLQQFMTAKLEKEKDKGRVFLEENKKRPGVIALPSGLQYEIITKGSGPIPQKEDTVSAHYIGALLDGKEFDNSYKRGKPLEIPVGGVIKGWTEALMLMKVGSKWKLYIPSDLAYGDRGAGGLIPGGATLVFTIDLLDIVNK